MAYIQPSMTAAKRDVRDESTHAPGIKHPHTLATEPDQEPSDLYLVYVNHITTHLCVPL